MTLTDARPDPAPLPPVPEPVVAVRSGGPLRLALLVGVVVLIGLRGGLEWLAIIGALVVMIFLHELGHFVTAKWSGMKVTQFFLGFGPRIWSVQRGETEYGIKAIPAGAYVKVIGMYDVDQVEPGEEARTYRQKKYYQRVIMAAAGSTTHFLLALLLIFGVLVGVGRQSDARWQIAAVSEGSAAAAAGLAVGDRLLSVDGVSVLSWDAVPEVVGPRQNETVPIVFVRDGTTRTVTATLGVNPKNSEMGHLGVGRSFPYERVGVLEAIPAAGREFGAVIVASVGGMGKLFTPSGLGSFADQVAEGKPSTKSPPSEEQIAQNNENRVISIFGAARLGVDLEGVGPTLKFIALLNIFIGVFNLVPLLPFDGGHIAIATYERLQELRKGSGRRHFTNVSRLMPLTYAVVFLLLALGLSSIYLDVVNPLQLP